MDTSLHDKSGFFLAFFCPSLKVDLELIRRPSLLSANVIMLSYVLQSIGSLPQAEAVGGVHCYSCLCRELTLCCSCCCSGSHGGHIFSAEPEVEPAAAGARGRIQPGPETQHEETHLHGHVDTQPYTHARARTHTHTHTHA